MVVAAFPAAKLGALLLKQISKPIANVVKSQAKSSPIFRKYVCLPPAQFYNWCEVKTKMWLLELGQPVNITVLNEASAIELGAELLGEGIIFMIAAGILIAEYSRSSRKEEAKEEAKKVEMQELQRALRELFMRQEEQSARLRELYRKFGELETRVVQKPWVPKPKKSGDPPEDSPLLIIPGPIAVEDEADQSVKSDQVELMKDSSGDVNFLDNSRCNNNNKMFDGGLIWKGIFHFEKTFFNDRKIREDGVLSVALNHLYKDVYRISLSF